jgi:hypothetical protein
MRTVPLLLEALAVCVVILGPKGRARFDLFGVQFVIVAAIYHGLTEVMQSIFPDANFYRRFVNEEDVTAWLWIVSGSLLIFACAYVVSSRFGTRSVRPSASNAVSLERPWLWLLMTVPIYLIYVFGVTDVDSYWAGGLAQQFLLLGIVLTSVACVQAGVSPVMAIVIQTGAASLLASRLYTVSLAIMLLTALYTAGVRLRYREALYSGVLLALVVPTISLARASVGRQQLLGGVAARADGISKGGQLLASGQGAADLIDDFVYRFDGNTFPALIYNQYERGHSAAGILPLVNDIWVAVPAFLNPSKTDADVISRNDAGYTIAWFGLPDSTTVSFVPTQLGVLYGCTGVILFPLVLALCGVLAEQIDRRLGRLRSTDGLILKVGLCQANLFMEMGFIVYPVALRGALVLIAVTRLVAWSSRVVKASRATTTATCLDVLPVAQQVTGEFKMRVADTVGGARK